MAYGAFLFTNQFLSSPPIRLPGSALNLLRSRVRVPSGVPLKGSRVRVTLEVVLSGYCSGGFGFKEADCGS